MGLKEIVATAIALLTLNPLTPANAANIDLYNQKRLQEYAQVSQLQQELGKNETAVRLATLKWCSTSLAYWKNTVLMHFECLPARHSKIHCIWSLKAPHPAVGTSRPLSIANFCIIGTLSTLPPAKMAAFAFTVWDYVA